MCRVISGSVTSGIAERQPHVDHLVQGPAGRLDQVIPRTAKPAGTPRRLTATTGYADSRRDGSFMDSKARILTGRIDGVSTVSLPG